MRRCRNAFVVAFAFAVVGLVPASAAAAATPGSGRKSESPSSAPAPKPPSPPTAPAAPLPPSAPNVALPAAATPSGPKSGQLVPPKTPELVGTVIYVKGARVVAEVEGGVKEKERFRLYDVASRLRGEAVVRKALDEATCLLAPVGSVTIAVGDRLARVRE